MYIRVNHKLINIQRNHYNTDEDFYQAIIQLKYKITTSPPIIDKLFSMTTI
jgi:hypothetical protein